MKKIIFVLSLLIFSFSIFADLGNQLKDWYKKQNINVTKGGAYKGQTTGYYTFGGVSTRAEIAGPFSIGNVQAPKYSAGCGGIDLYTGGISAINAKEFIENLRHIAQNGQSLVFMLALQIVTPQITSTLETIQNWANKYLTLNMDSCQAATKLLGGSMELLGEKNGNCIVGIMQENNRLSWTEAQHHCSGKGLVNQQENSKKDPNNPGFVNGNMAWHVLMHNEFFRKDLELSQLVMNLTGTFISYPETSGPHSDIVVVKITPALKGGYDKTRFDKIYNVLLYGNQKEKLKIYTCKDKTADKQSCMKISNDPEEISSKWDGLYKMVDNQIKSIVKKFKKNNNNGKLLENEITLIKSTRIPLYKFLATSTAFFPQDKELLSENKDITKLIAEDILLKSLQDIISHVEDQSSKLKNNISDTTKIKGYKKDLEELQKGLSTKRKKIQISSEKILEIRQRIVLYEKALISRLNSRLINNALWR